MNASRINLEKGRISEACGLLYEASKTVRILTHLSWPSSVREKFFAAGCRELPVVEYGTFDSRETLDRLNLARAKFQFDPLVNDWLNLTAYQIETSARMLATCGTLQFFRHSADLYGAPKDKLADEENTTLGLANQLSETFAEFDGVDMGIPDDATASSEEVAAAMTREVALAFGDQAPEVSIVDELSANALAGPSRIRVRRGARFSDRDVLQLVHHEAHIHVGTSLNGIAQEHLQILAASHPGTTKTQEGLAVFSEFITGSMDIDRFHRLADRVITIQMAIEGADFLDVYRYYLERIGHPEQAYECTRRVFRGGVVEGGGPFTKDIVYLDGLVRVHNFLRTMVAVGRADCLRLLFCGKLDLEDLPVLGAFAEQGICLPPTFLPPWAKDIRFLLCYLAYSSFLNRIDLTQVKRRFVEMLDAIPVQSN